MDYAFVFQIKVTDLNRLQAHNASYLTIRWRIRNEKLRQYTQCTYKATVWRIHLTIVATEKQLCVLFSIVVFVQNILYFLYLPRSTRSITWRFYVAVDNIKVLRSWTILTGLHKDSVRASQRTPLSSIRKSIHQLSLLMEV